MLLCSTHEGDRTFAVQKVLEVRAMEGERSPVRTRHNVTLNKDATCLQNLIVWNPMKTNEPVLAQQLSGEDLKEDSSDANGGRLLPSALAGSGNVREGGDHCQVSHVRIGQEGRIRNGAAGSLGKIRGAVKSKKDHAMICT